MVFTLLSFLGSMLILQSTQVVETTAEIGHMAAEPSHLFGQSEQCSNDLISFIWSELPKCIPRDTIIQLELPDDPDVVEVRYF